MRTRLPVLALALVLVSLPPISAQAADAAAPAGPLVEDVAGDVKADVNGSPTAPPTAVHPELDLLSLTVREDVGAFHFTVQATDVKTGQDDASNVGQAVYIEFQHASRAFRIRIVHIYQGIDEFTGAALDFRDSDTGTWNQAWFRNGGATLDAQAETYSVDVGRDDLADAEGAAPFPGRSLEKVFVHSNNLLGEQGFIQIMGTEVAGPGRFADSMPDSGTAPNSYPIQLGLRQTGHARLSSAEPFRASNGEGTTFIFKAQAKNTGDATQTFRLAATSVPPGWSVVLPQPTLEIEAGSDIEVPVLLTVPFNHVHGVAMSFVLEMTGTSDPGSVGRLEMGIRYLTVPQPAGHHDTIYFHSAGYNQFSQALATVFTGNEGYPFMNALDTYEGDAAMALSPASSDWTTVGDQPYADYSWCVSLDPGLQMGLDFKTKEKAHVKFPVHTTAPLNGAFLEGSLFLLPPGADLRYGCYPWRQNADQNVVLANLNATSPKDVAANTDQVLEGDLDMTGASDRIPYVKGQSLALFIHVLGVGAPTFFEAQGTPRLVPGGQLTLPLLEYHDDVKGVLTTLKGPALSPLGPQERKANPGATIVFPISVANEGDAERTLGFNVTGTNTAWAVLPAGGSVLVPAHGTARADIVVHVPADAKDGESADVVVQAFDRADEASRGLLRLVVNVDTKEKHPDDLASMASSNPTKRSPAWAPLGIVGVLAAVALLRRREFL